MSQQQYYRTLVDLHREVPVFFRPWWLDIVCHTWDVALVEQNGQITGIMPYQVEKKAGIRLLRNPPLTPYQGPWIRPAQDMEPYKLWNREEDIFNRLWAQIPAFDSYDIMTMPGFQNFLLFHAKGFDNNIRLTYHIDLGAGEPELLGRMQRSHRKRIEQAEKLYSIEAGTAYTDVLLALHRKTFERKHKKYVYAPEMIRSIIEQSYRQGSGNLLVAKDERGHIAGTIYTVRDNTHCYLLLSAVDTEKAHKGTICLLVWNALLEAKKSGIRTFDFEGSMDAGIEVFFRNFGGRRQAYLAFHRNTSFIWKLKKAFLG